MRGQAERLQLALRPPIFRFATFPLSVQLALGLALSVQPTSSSRTVRTGRGAFSFMLTELPLRPAISPRPEVRCCQSLNLPLQMAFRSRTLGVFLIRSI